MMVLSVRRADCALSKISMHKGTSAMLEPKIDGNDDEITSLLFTALGVHRATPDTPV